MKKVLLTVTFMLPVLLLFAQRTVTGKVTDDKGNPLANVSVIVKGTSVGTTTKTDGTYSLGVPANGKILVFSSIDMGTQEISVSSSSISFSQLLCVGVDNELIKGEIANTRLICALVVWICDE